MADQLAYCCPIAGCGRLSLVSSDTGLHCPIHCPNNIFYPFVPGTKVPVFVQQLEETNEYSRTNAAEMHDNSLRWLFATFETDEALLRERLVAKLELVSGQKVLVTGAGTGNDLPYLAHHLGGQGEIYAQDIAQQMLLVGVERHQTELEHSGVEVHFSVSDATNLPFEDDYFDAAYHFGGINLFPDIRQGIVEMNRVVKSGGKVLIGDEGIAPWLRDSEYAKMLIRNNPLYACEAPVDLLPAFVRDVKLSWELSNCFYILEFSVSSEPLPININVPHVGKRGGSIRTRYFGQLEGINPDLRDLIYIEAERLGVSRVEYIESLLRSGFSGH